MRLSWLICFVSLTHVFSSMHYAEEEANAQDDSVRDRPKFMCGFVNHEDDIPPVHHKLTLRMLEAMPKAVAQKALGERLWVKLNNVRPDSAGMRNGQIVDELFVLYGYPELLKFLKSRRGLKRAAEMASPILDRKLEKHRTNVSTSVAWEWINPKRYTVCPVDPIKDLVAATKTKKKSEQEERERQKRQITAEFMEEKGLKQDTFLSDAMESEIEEKLKLWEKSRQEDLGSYLNDDIQRTLEDSMAFVEKRPKLIREHDVPNSR